MPTPQPHTAPADEPDTPHLPTAPRRERTAMRISAALALLGWPTGIALVANQDTGRSTLDSFMFAFLASWAIGLGCLGLGIAFLRPRDPLAAWEHGLGSCAWTQRVLAHTATGCWVIALVYTATMLGHVYKLPPMASVFTLILPLAAAIWLTVIVLVAPAKTRLETAYRLEHADAEQFRAERRLHETTAAAVASLALDEAESASPQHIALDRRHGMRAVDDNEYYPRPTPSHPATRGRDASGQ